MQEVTYTGLNLSTLSGMYSINSLYNIRVALAQITDVAEQASKASPNSDPQGKALQSDQPKKAGGASQ